MQNIKIDPGLLEFEGLGVAGVAKTLFRLTKSKILAHFELTGNRSMLLEAYLIPDVVADPTGIWRGLQREGQEHAMCYAGIPAGNFAAQCLLEVEIPANRVFLVFMTSQREITKWRFSEQDPDRSGFPLGHQERFGERLWPHN